MDEVVPSQIVSILSTTPLSTFLNVVRWSVLGNEGTKRIYRLQVTHRLVIVFTAYSPSCSLSKVEIQVPEPTR
jgi:hypothetical protein